MNKFFLPVFGLLLCTFSANAQRVVADKIVAKLGDQIILKSDIDGYVLQYKMQAEQEGGGIAVPENMDCAVLRDKLMQKALIIQAKRDSLPLPDDELDGSLDNRIRYLMQVYGASTREAFETLVGKSIYQFKDEMRSNLKDEILAQKMRSKITENVRVTPEEVEAFYNNIPKDSLPYYESELELNQIIVTPKPTKEVDDFITNRLLEWKQQIETGKQKMETLARTYSQDPAVKENGGQYSINRKSGGWDPDFLTAAFRLKEGQVSPVVKSQFGYHIIQMVSRAGDDAIVRHILLIPPVTEAEIDSSKKFLDSLRIGIIKGYIPFNIAVARFSDDKDSRDAGGQISYRNPATGEISTRFPIDKLQDRNLIPILDTLKEGGISAPIVETDERGRKTVRIIQLKSRTTAHRLNLADDYEKISAMALNEKQARTLNDWFKTHISTFYLHIDKSYAQCSILTDWFKASETEGTN
jgi:peptidyl-prolyl cis-trans isomerase SurA